MASIDVQTSSASAAAADAFFDLDAIEQEAGLGLLSTAAPEAAVASGAVTSATTTADNDAAGNSSAASGAASDVNTTTATAMTKVLSTPKKSSHIITQTGNNTNAKTPSRALSTSIDLTSPCVTALAVINSASKDEAAAASAAISGGAGGIGAGIGAGIGPVQWSPARLSTGLGYASSLFGGHAGGSTDLSSPTGGGGLPSLLSPTSTFAHAILDPDSHPPPPPSDPTYSEQPDAAGGMYSEELNYNHTQHTGAGAGAYTISPDEPVITYAPTGLPYTPSTTSIPTATSTDVARHAQALGSPWGSTALLEMAASGNAGAGGYTDPNQTSSANQIKTKKRRRSTGNRKRPKITISASALSAATANATVAANIGTNLQSPTATSCDSDSDSDYDDPTNDAVSAIAAASAALSSGRSRPSTTSSSSTTGRRSLLPTASGKARTPAQIAGVERRKKTMAKIREEQDRLEALGLSPKEIDRKVQKLRDELTEERRRLQLERDAAAKAKMQPRAASGGGSRSKKKKKTKKKQGSGSSRKIDSKSLSWTTPSQQQPRLPPIDLSLSSTAGSVTLPESQMTRSGRVSVKRSFGEDFHDNIDDASTDDASDDPDEELDVDFIAGLPVEQALDDPIETPLKSMNELYASRGDMSASNNRGIGSNADALRFVTPSITPKSTALTIPFSSSIESTGGIGQATDRGMAAKQSFSSYPPPPSSSSSSSSSGEDYGPSKALSVRGSASAKKGKGKGRKRPPKLKASSDSVGGGQSRAAAPKKRRRSNSNDLGGGRGAWTQEEDELFARAIEMYGNSWTKVAAAIASRTAAQCKSHNQKIQMRRLKAAMEEETD